MCACSEKTHNGETKFFVVKVGGGGGGLVVVDHCVNKEDIKKIIKERHVPTFLVREIGVV